MTHYRSSYDTPEQALAEALFPALTAPGEQEAEAAAMIADEPAVGLNEATAEK